MTAQDFGANEFTFTGDRTQITYFPVAPGPGPVHPGQEGGLFQYHGPEGDLTFRGDEIVLTKSSLGMVVGVALSEPPDRRTITANVLLPHVTGVVRDKPVTFDTLLVKTTRGTATPGQDPTYTIVPLLGQAADVILPV